MLAPDLPRPTTTIPQGVRVPLVEETPNLGIEWDAENRLIAVNNGAARSEFSYDGLDHRVRTIEKSGGSVISDRRFVWCDADVCEERDTATNGVTKALFLSGAQIGGVAYFYTRDQLTSLRDVVDSAGTVRARYDYDPYGRRTRTSGDLESDLGFGGYWFHPASGLQLATYRAYDADVGRWLSEDPAHDDLNPYRFVFDDPVGYFDWDGWRARGGSGKKPPKSSPKPPTPPTPTPSPPPGPPVWPRPVHQLPWPAKFFDLCDKPAEKLVWWAEVNANPNSQWPVVKAWEEKFIKICRSVGKGRTSHFSSGTNPQASGGPATVSVWGCCCEPCKP